MNEHAQELFISAALFVPVYYLYSNWILPRYVSHLRSTGRINQ